MTTFIVTNAADSGAGSLRDVVAQANASAGTDTITFDQAVFKGEAADRIRLTSGQITITDNLVIDGGPNGVLITGDANGDDVTYAGGVTNVAASLAGEDRLDDNTRIFDAFNAFEVTLQRLTLTGGRTTGTREGGGAITVLGELRLIDSTLAGNSTTGDYATGGAAKATNIVMTNATLVGNSTTGDAAGGGAAYAGNLLRAINSTVTGNSTAGVGILTPPGFYQGLSHFTYSAAGGGLFGDVLEIGGSIVTGNATFGAGVGNENIGYFRSADIAYYVAQNGAGAIVPLLGRAREIGTNLLGYQAGNLLFPATGQNVSIADARLPGFAGGSPNSDPPIPPKPIFATSDIFAATTTLPNGTLAGVLADNGGPVPTVALRAIGANPAIDRSDATPADARGTAAFEITGQGNESEAFRDLGAFEATGPVVLPLVVTTAADIVDGFDGVTSLREAVNYANRHAGDDTVTFDPTVFDGSPGAMIRLTQGAIRIGISNTTDKLTIDGGPAGVTITGDALANDVTDAQGITDVMASIAGTNRLADNSRVFEHGRSLQPYGYGKTIGTGLTTLAHLTLTGGYAEKEMGGNRAGFGGGAVTVDFLALVDSTVVGNAAGVSSANWGGGVAAFEVSLLRSTVANNRALGDFNFGGGIFSKNLLTMMDSTVTGNATLGRDGDGGGIRSLNLSFTPDVITNSTIADNHVYGDGSTGGGISGYRMTLVNSTVTGNTTAGGLGVGTLDGQGGGIFAARPLTLSNTIVMGNQTLGAGVGGDNIWLRVDGVLVLTNNNILGNDSGTGDIFHGTTDVGDTTAAAVFADTLVLAGGVVAGVLGHNGGPTETVALLLDPANPAIGGADPATAADTDQRGETRDARPDLGAFEAGNDTPLTTPDSATAGRDSGIFLNILGNDDDLVGGLDPATVQLLGADPGSDGRTLTVAGTGTWVVDPVSGAVTFTPEAGFQGSATAFYTVADVFGLLSPATAIAIDVAPGARGTATAGDDRLFGSLYGDSIDGLGGNDSILGRAGFDILKGGDGNDTIDAGRDFDSVEGGAGDDVILLRGGIQSRDDILAGGDGFDTVRVAPGVVAVTLTHTDWTGVEAFDGSGAKVLGTIIGDALDFSGFASVTGIAMLNGRAGDDTITGSAGADSILGNAGADWLTGGAGNDTMAGGQGQDSFIFGPGFGQDVILGFDARPAGGQDLLVLQGYAGVPEVLFAVVGGDTRVTIGTDSVLLVGVTGIGTNAVSLADVQVVPDAVLE